MYTYIYIEYIGNTQNPIIRKKAIPIIRKKAIPTPPMGKRFE